MLKCGRGVQSKASSNLPLVRYSAVTNYRIRPHHDPCSRNSSIFGSLDIDVLKITRKAMRLYSAAGAATGNKSINAAFDLMLGCFKFDVARRPRRWRCQ